MPQPHHKPTLLFLSGKHIQSELGGGHSSYVRTHVQAVNAMGIKPWVLCVHSHHRAEHTDAYTQICVQSPLGPFFLNVYPNGIRTRGYLMHRAALIRGVVRFLHEHPEPVIIHGFSVWTEAAVAAIRRAKRNTNIRLITSQYTLQNQEHLSKLQGARAFSLGAKLRFGFEYVLSKTFLTACEKTLYRANPTVLVNYQCVRNMIEDTHGNLDDVRIVPYCTELAFEDPLSSPPPPLPSPLTPGRPLFISVSRHDPRKGVNIFIQSLGILKNRGVQFTAVVIGIGELLHANRALADELQLNDCVSIPGFLPDILPWLMHCDIFVLPSLEEQSGSMSLLEAMQCGACCVSSAVDGMMEDIEDGRNGRLVTPGDADDMAKVLEELLVDPEQRAALGREARLSFETRFHPRQLTQYLSALYDE